MRCTVVHSSKSHANTRRDISADKLAVSRDDIISDACAEVDDEDVMSRILILGAYDGCYAVRTEGLGCAIGYLDGQLGLWCDPKERAIKPTDRTLQVKTVLAYAGTDSMVDGVGLQ